VSTSVRVLIADDHEIVRRGVRSLLETHPALEVCGEAVDGQDAVDAAKQLNPDVVVLDISMPHLSGLEAARLIRKAVPRTEILILSQHDSSEVVNAALEAGARGYVVKSDVSRDLLTAVELVMQHKIAFSSTVKRERGWSSDRETETPSRSKLASKVEPREASSTGRTEAASDGFTLFNLAPLGIVRCDSYSGKFVEVNDCFCRLLGYTRQELQSLTLWDVTHEDDLARNRDGLTGHRSTTEPFEIEKRYVRKDGTVIWAQVTSNLILDAEHRPQSWLSFVADITERKQAEQALRISEEEFRALADSIVQLVWMAEPDGYIFWYNRGWYEYTGTTPEQMAGWGWQAIHDPAVLPKVVERWKESLRTGNTFEMEFPLRGADGIYRWFLTRSVPVKDSSGRVVRWCGTNTNIHEQRESRRALQESQARLNAALAASAMGTFRWDPSTGEYIEADENLKRLFGISADEPASVDRFLARVHPDDLAELQARIEACRNGADFEMEFRVVLPDGSTRWLYDRGKLLADGESKYLVGACTDITARQEAEEALRRAHSELESVVEQRTAALRQLSARLLHIQDEERRRIARELHDSLGQYLTAAKINLDILRTSPAGTNPEMLQEAGTLIEQALSETRTLSHLLHPPLLDEAGFDSAARWYVDGFAKRSGIQVELDIASELQRLPSAIEIALFRVLQESLTNVHRHSESESVEICLRRTDSGVELQVIDHGRGLPAEVLQCFETTGTNTGVGLAGMRERVKELGGRLHIHSTDKGTVLVARIPIAEALSIRQAAGVQRGAGSAA
jgi:PAS domain S-box-containing protein